MRVTILDYGVGNLHSLAKAVARSGHVPEIVDDPAQASRAAVLVLPGVGAFAPAAGRLAPALLTLRRAILDGLPTLGICLGMQLMFEESEEGAGKGLGVFEGRVTRLDARAVPQIGWNTLAQPNDPLLEASGLVDVYYANSYVCRASDPATVGAWTEHEGDRFPALVRHGNSVGVQFHPEKSSAPGVAFIGAFLEEVTA